MLITMLITAAIVFVVATLLRNFIAKKSEQAVARFLLPEGSDKEYFVDPANGNKYDKEAYEAYMKEYVGKLQDKQLQGVYQARNAREDVWNKYLCEAVHTEMLRRANMERGSEYDEDEDEEVEEETYSAIDAINDDIAPFFWVEQAVGASIGLDCGEYLQERFDALGLAGTGYDWNRVAEAFLADKDELSRYIKFDSQEHMFCAYSKDAAMMKKFAYKFCSVCEDPRQADELFRKLEK